MSFEQNKAVVRRWHKILNEHDLDAFDEVLHPDYANRSSRTEVWGERIVGIEAAKAYFASAFEGGFGEVTNVIDDILAEGDKVAARLTWVRDGKPFGAVLAMFRLQDGKIIDDWFTSRMVES
jgi:ketosteroid isomerase-like protein